MENIDTNEKMLEEAFVQAKRARENAYAPYSGFKVGAVLIGREMLYPGCNVENASYGATICAERTALTGAVARERSPEFRALVVVTGANPPSVPCALCLQVLSEFCSPDFPVYLADTEGIKKKMLLKELIPYPFNVIPPV